MIKKALLLVLGVGLTTSVLFGRNAASYVSTTYHRLTSTVEDAVPVDFQIERAKQMVRDLDPEIRRSMHVIAKEEVAVEQLNTQITGNQDKVDSEKKDILRLQSDLGQNKSVYHYASRTFSCDEVKQDLSRRFNRFKVSDDTLASMKQMRDAREKNLDAARQKLSAMINARRKLDVDGTFRVRRILKRHAQRRMPGGTHPGSWKRHRSSSWVSSRAPTMPGAPFGLTRGTQPA